MFETENEECSIYRVFIVRLAVQKNSVTLLFLCGKFCLQCTLIMLKYLKSIEFDMHLIDT